jgi:D-glycero-D-manno-heptose 1,7-bisphosphate phosphatase
MFGDHIVLHALIHVLIDHVCIPKAAMDLTGFYCAMKDHRRTSLRKFGPMRPPEYPLNAEGVWCEVLRRLPAGRPALFLDRDGAIVEETGYLCHAEDIVMIKGAAEVIAAANRRVIPVVVVTNQAGIGHGYYSWQEFRRVQQAVIAALADEGARFDAVYACAHHPEGRAEFSHPDHPARKPNPGMLLRAASDLAIDLKTSWLIGDKASDIEAARRAGLAGAMHVATGYGIAERELAAALATSTFEVRIGRSIKDAITVPILSAQEVG